MNSEQNNIANAINAFYEKHKRDLPWRKVNDPYLVWVSEIILQQTRVDQGLPYYSRFIEEFPSVAVLAIAEEAAVLKVWQGLGYYSRARNMQAAADQILEQHGAKFPTDYHSLLKLKGVGPYTAAAIASICSREKVAAVDGNVIRVVSRIFGIDIPFDSVAGKKIIAETATQLIQAQDPGHHNQAMMEFGALVCTPRKPDCGACPVVDSCCAKQEGRVDELPVKDNKTKKRSGHLWYFDIRQNDRILLRQRSGSGIWRGMYDLPGVSMDLGSGVEDALIKFCNDQGITLKSTKVLKEIGPIRHQLTHRDLNIHFVVLDIGTTTLTSPNIKTYSAEMLEELPFPKPISDYLNTITIGGNKATVGAF